MLSVGGTLANLPVSVGDHQVGECDHRVGYRGRLLTRSPLFLAPLNRKTEIYSSAASYAEHLPSLQPR